MTPRTPSRGDLVDLIVGQWAELRPDLDASPIAVIGRISRASRLIDRRLGAQFARHGLDDWMYDVLATLRRGGPPHELTAGRLVELTMVTTGAITNRIDRLVERGLVERDSDPHDRRKVIVRLTDAGRETVDRVAADHLAEERDILAPLDDDERATLADLLRRLLIDLGDRAPD